MRIGVQIAERACDVWPNITGSFGQLLTNKTLSTMGEADGAFRTGGSVYGYVEAAEVAKRSETANDGISFDSSRSSSIFSGSKFQFPACQTLMIIKI